MPGTPLDLVAHLIRALDEQDRKTQAWWRFGQRSSVFAPCLELMQTINLTHVVQNIDAKDSTLSGIAFTVDTSHQPIPPSLVQAFQDALGQLHKKAQVERRFGGVGKPQPRPLILVLVDTVELAPAPLRDWLPAHLNTLIGNGGLHYHALVVAAGRQRLAGFIDTELSPLNPDDSATFLRVYVAARLRQDPDYATQSARNQVTDNTPTQRGLIDLSEGIPLLLQLLADLVVAHAPHALDLPSRSRCRP